MAEGVKERRVHSTLSTCSGELLSSATRCTRAISPINTPALYIWNRRTFISIHLLIYSFIDFLFPSNRQLFLRFSLSKKETLELLLSAFCSLLILVRFVAVLISGISVRLFGFYRFLLFRWIVCVNLVFSITWF